MLGFKTHEKKEARRRSSSHQRPQKTQFGDSQLNGAFARVDKILLYITVALAVLGLTTVFSASATEALEKYHNALYFAQRQFIFFVLGFGLMYGVSKIPFFEWSKATKIMAFLVIGLLAYTMLNGVQAYGAERWIRIGGFQFQPSELGKISVVLLLAQALGQKAKLDFSSFLNYGLIFITLFLIVKQPSLSMTIILSTVSGGLFLIAGAPIWLLGLVGTGGIAYFIHKITHTAYQMRRIQGWLNPWKDAQDSGYNLIQSLYAIGSGGVVGTGLGMSHQKLFYLPFQHTDFIFSVWSEEWGLIGCVLLIGLFCVLLYRGYVIAKTCRSAYGQILAMGITMMLGAQIIINMFVATGLFPVTGVTLPLISYGGTSVLVTMMMIGMLMNISRYRVVVSMIYSPSQI